MRRPLGIEVGSEAPRSHIGPAALRSWRGRPANLAARSTAAGAIARGDLGRARRRTATGSSHRRRVGSRAQPLTRKPSRSRSSCAPPRRHSPPTAIRASPRMTPDGCGFKAEPSITADPEQVSRRISQHGTGVVDLMELPSDRARRPPSRQSGARLRRRLARSARLRSGQRSVRRRLVPASRPRPPGLRRPATAPS